MSGRTERPRRAAAAGASPADATAAPLESGRHDGSVGLNPRTFCICCGGVDNRYDECATLMRRSFEGIADKMEAIAVKNQIDELRQRLASNPLNNASWEWAWPNSGAAGGGGGRQNPPHSGDAATSEAGPAATAVKEVVPPASRQSRKRKRKKERKKEQQGGGETPDQEWLVEERYTGRKGRRTTGSADAAAAAHVSARLSAARLPREVLGEQDDVSQGQEDERPQEEVGGARRRREFPWQQATSAAARCRRPVCIRRQARQCRQRHQGRRHAAASRNEWRRYLYVTEPYHNTSVQQQLIVRADRVASCRAAGAEARAAQQMTIVEMVERIEHLKQREEEAQQPDVVARRVASTIVDQLRSSKSRPPGARLSNTVFLDDQSAVASKMLFGILKSQVASSPVLHVSLPLMDPTSGTVRSGAKADLLDGVWTPNPAMAVPSASGGVGSGFAAVIIDFSAVLVRVCATLKRSLAKKRKESKVAICTFGEVVNAALDFSMSLTRRAGAAAMYLAVDPYPSDAEEKTSVKRWSHLDRAKNKISARRYDNIESSTVVVGGPDKLLDALTVSHNKRQLMQLTYSRLSELCLGTEFLRKGESIAWVSDTHGYGKENHFHRRDDVDAGTSSMVDELLSTAPEADFKFGHAIDHWVAGGGAKDPRPVCLWVEDTDVVTHIVTRYWRRCTTPAGAMSDGTDAEEPQQHPGVAFMRGRAGITTYQHVGAIAEHLVKTHGEEAAAILMDVLHGVHVLSGCDYTSFLAGKKKKTFWNVVTSMIQHEKFRVVLRGGVAKLSSEDAVTVDGEHLEVVREVLDNLETFWACLHLPPAVLHKVGESDDATTTPRLGTARTVANPNFLDGEAFPISRAELHEHALRCAYVLKQFRVGTESANAAKDHRSADGWGFEIDKDGYLQVRWVRGNVKTLAQMVGVKTKRGAADAADAAAVPAAAAGPAAEQPGAALTEAEDGEDELDAFWGDDAPPVPIVSAGIPPAGAVPVCNLPIEQGATIATCKDGTWRIGEVTRVELAKVFVQWMADEEGAEEEILRSTLVSKEYGKQWVEISVDMMQQ
mmetsp:Transcript_32425/g.97664  ORF Transcript_32425/g.97664 Transcript_32425/m.97664 type:complete len:1060 (+) Transcript_32425:718-3897(+)